MVAVVHEAYHCRLLGSFRCVHVLCPIPVLALERCDFSKKQAAAFGDLLKIAYLVMVVRVVVKSTFIPKKLAYKK